MDFKEELKKYVDIINKELEKYVIKEDVPENVLNRSTEYSLMAGGKRIRPVLMMATYKMFYDDFEKCFPFAIAIEMIHNFSLIHDDLPCIDDDDFRHGKPTNHKQFNEATAVLAGDNLLNSAYIVISKELVKNNSVENIRAFNELSIGVDRMIAGEYIDTEYEGNLEIANKYLEYMNQNKTGALLKACVRIGAILAKASEEDIEKLTEYSEKIGLTFQIKDDILSKIGDEKILRKPVGNDEEKNKCTYVTKYGLEKAQEMLDELTNQAVNITKEFGEKAKFLEELALYIKNRQK